MWGDNSKVQWNIEYYGVHYNFSIEDTSGTKIYCSIQCDLSIEDISGTRIHCSIQWNLSIEVTPGWNLSIKDTLDSDGTRLSVILNKCLNY